jgi:hypothetical protein
MRVHSSSFKGTHRFQWRGRLAICMAAALLAAAFANQWEKRQVLAQQQPVATVASNAAESTSNVPILAQNSNPLAQSNPKTGATQPKQAMPAAPSTGAKASVDTVGALNTPVLEEAANLLKLANSLKADVDKTTKDTLSVAVVREAGQIEQLAHKMRTQ